MGTMTGLRLSWRELALAQKDGAGVPFYTRAVNRPLGRGLACVASRAGVTPDQVTAASALSALAGLALVVLFEPGIAVAVAATVLLQLAFAFDSADGQVARLTGRGSSAGEWLDHVVDCARNLAFHLAILISLYRFGAVPDGVLLIALAFGFVASVRFFALILADQLERGHPTRVARGGTSRSALIQTPADTGIQNLVLLLLPWTTAFVVVYGLLAAANTLLLLASVSRRRRALRMLGAEAPV